MNSLDQYAFYKNSLLPGDLVVFEGSPANPLSNIIHVLSGGGPSHSSMVLEAATQTKDVIITQSTMDFKGLRVVTNGVQNDPLGGVLEGYGWRAAASALILADSVRAKIDPAKLVAFANLCAGTVKYDVADLFEFCVREIPILGAYTYQGEHTMKMVCSSYITAVLTHFGVVSGEDWTKMMPEDLVRMGLYKCSYPLLRSMKLVGFNSLA